MTLGKASSFRAARILSKTIKAILLRLSQVLIVSFLLRIMDDVDLLGTHMREQRDVGMLEKLRVDFRLIWEYIQPDAV